MLAETQVREWAREYLAEHGLHDRQGDALSADDLAELCGEAFGVDWTEEDDDGPVALLLTAMCAGELEIAQAEMRNARPTDGREGVW
jgi:hypothetical protein